MIVYVMWAMADLLDALMNLVQNKSLLKEWRKNVDQMNHLLRVPYTSKTTTRLNVTRPVVQKTNSTGTTVLYQVSFNDLNLNGGESPVGVTTATAGRRLSLGNDILMRWDHPRALTFDEYRKEKDWKATSRHHSF